MKKFFLAAALAVGCAPAPVERYKIDDAACRVLDRKPEYPIQPACPHELYDFRKGMLIVTGVSAQGTPCPTAVAMPIRSLAEDGQKAAEDAFAPLAKKAPWCKAPKFDR